MRIGELAARTRSTTRALRYYEEQGLLTAHRTSGAQREYEDEAVDRVRLLRQLYAAGLSSTTIAQVLPCVDAPSSARTRDSLAVLRAEQQRIAAQIDQLERTRSDLVAIISSAEAHLAAPLAAGHAPAVCHHAG